MRAHSEKFDYSLQITSLSNFWQSLATLWINKTALCQKTLPKRWFGNMNMTSNFDFTNGGHQIQMSTIYHWMNPPIRIFLHTPLEQCVRWSEKQWLRTLRNS